MAVTPRRAGGCSVGGSVSSSLLRVVSIRLASIVNRLRLCLMEAAACLLPMLPMLPTTEKVSCVPAGWPELSCCCGPGGEDGIESRLRGQPTKERRADGHSTSSNRTLRIVDDIYERPACP